MTNEYQGSPFLLDGGIRDFNMTTRILHSKSLTSFPVRLFANLSSKSIAKSSIVAVDRLNATVELYPYDMIRVLGTAVGKKSRSHNFPDLESVQVVSKFPFSPWTATIL